VWRPPCQSGTAFVCSAIIGDGIDAPGPWRMPVSQHPRPLVSYVVPVFNEQESIAMFYDTLCSTISQREDLDFELVFIDDGSSDDSPALLAAFADEDPRVRTILLSRNFGHQAAVTAGMDAARGDAV